MDKLARTLSPDTIRNSSALAELNALRYLQMSVLCDKKLPCAVRDLGCQAKISLKVRVFTVITSPKIP